MSTEDQEELFKLENTDTRTNENEFAMNEVKLENKNEDSRYQVLQFGIALQYHIKENSTHLRNSFE